jgi:hypothetical protein
VLEEDLQRGKDAPNPRSAIRTSCDLPANVSRPSLASRPTPAGVQWLRLAEEQDDESADVEGLVPNAGEQSEPVVQQQQQVQPKGDDKKALPYRRCIRPTVRPWWLHAFASRPPPARAP